MQTAFIQIVRNQCPRCGGGERFPLRVQSRGGLPPPDLTVHSEVCLACQLTPLTREVRNYKRKQFADLWQQAIGPRQPLPPVLEPAGAASLAAPMPPAVASPCRMKARNGVHHFGPGRPPSFHIPLSTAPPARTVRVLVCSHDLSLSGGPIILANLVPYLRGFDPVVYSPKDGPLKPAFVERGIPVVHEARVEDFDLIVANTLLSAEMVEQAREEDVPCCWLIHEYTPDLCGNREVVRGLLHYPRLVVFPHESTAANYASMRTAGVRIVPSIIPPPPKKDRDEARKKLKVRKGEFVVLFVGQKEPRKGWDTFQAAVANLKVRVWRLCDEEDRWDYFAAADCLVNASVAESYPLSLQEGRAFGLPIIASSIPGNLAVLRAADGLRFSPGDTEQLRRHIEHLRASPATCAAAVALPEPILPAFAASVRSYERAFLACAGRGEDTPLRVVYHCAQFGPFRESIVREQLELLADAGLTRVLMTHCGELLDWTLDLAHRLGIDLTCTFHQDAIDCYERPAIELIERMAATSDLPILYFHSKGMSHTDPLDFNHNWRRLMQEVLVRRWQEHVVHLDDYDAVGVNWWSHPTVQHFAGNFWMAHPRWLRTLPPIKEKWVDRFSAERWMGYREGCNAKTLLCENGSFYEKDRVLFEQLVRKYVPPVSLPAVSAD